MTLQEKLKNITNPKLPTWNDGSAVTIKDFWDTFVEPRLQDKDTVIKWYHILLDYANDPNAVFVIRKYEDRQGGLATSLRRGFYSITDKGNRYFYTDNYFSHYFVKMALDGFVPTLQEMIAMMNNRTFPARFGKSCHEERDRAAFSIDGSLGKDPGFGKKDFKIAHIMDVGTDYLLDGRIQGLAVICDQYAPRGNYNDWCRDSLMQCYVRNLSITDSLVLKEFLKSHFLRLTCPMNYCLTPIMSQRKKSQSFNNSSISIKKNDIAETPEFQNYAMHRFYLRYGEDYLDFLKQIMLPNTVLQTISQQSLRKFEINGDITINITYSHNHTTKKASTTTVNPHTNPVCTNNSFKAFLRTVINRRGVHYSENVINDYCSALNDMLFLNILNNHNLPSDIYQCKDIAALKIVYDELRDRTNFLATQLYNTKHGKCTSALRQYSNYLRVNRVAVNDSGEVFN